MKRSTKVLRNISPKKSWIKNPPVIYKIYGIPGVTQLFFVLQKSAFSA
jgi:hypothetical protein